MTGNLGASLHSSPEATHFKHLTRLSLHQNKPKSLKSLYGSLKSRPERRALPVWS